MYKCERNGHAYIVFCGSQVFKEPSVVARVLYAQLGKQKKIKNQLFLFESFDLSHLSVEHRITSDYYQSIHAARYHTIHIYCLWFKPFSCSSGSCFKKYHTLFPNAVTLCEKEMLHFSHQVLLFNVLCSYMSKVFMKHM